jgi:hypothetical protein
MYMRPLRAGELTRTLASLQRVLSLPHHNVRHVKGAAHLPFKTTNVFVKLDESARGMTTSDKQVYDSKKLGLNCY